MMESDLGLDLDCAHTNVEFTPYVCVEHEDMHDAWTCEECGAEFVPLSEVDEWREAAHELRDALVEMGNENIRLRVLAVLAGIFTFGVLVGRQ